MKNKWDDRIKNVTWGYRDRFSDSLKRLRESGYLDITGEDTSYKVFDDVYMQLVGKDYCTDHAADVFLKALDKKLSWIISIPDILENWSGYGLRLLSRKLYYAIRYFSLWDKNPSVTDQAELRMILQEMSRIETASDVEAALSFLEGYPEIRKMLDVGKIHHFVSEGLKMFENRPSMSGRFFRLELSCARILAESISRRCCLQDIQARIERLLRSICGYDFVIGKTNELDSDELIEKGSITVCFGKSLYLPEVISDSDDLTINTKWYLAAVYSNAFGHLFKGFSILHGMEGFESSSAYLANSGAPCSFLAQKLFYISDIYRIFKAAFTKFPGSKKIIEDVARAFEKEESLLDKILVRIIKDDTVNEWDKIDQFIYNALKKTELCGSFHEIKDLLPDITNQFMIIFGDDMAAEMNAFSFHSDYRFEAGLSCGPVKDNKIFDHGKKNVKQNTKNANSDKKDINDELYCDMQAAVFKYDEWDNNTMNYLPDWCSLYEIYGSEGWIDNSEANTFAKYAKNDIRQVFERLKPDLIKQKKDLNAGDDLLLDRMICHMVETKAGIRSEGKIYARRYKDERDIAVAVLIDISGSTSEKSNGLQVLETEKVSVLMLADGLKQLGDDFGVFGFSGTGKDHCCYHIFKDFADEWGKKEQTLLQNCRPQGSTRIGPAIRHTIMKLRLSEHKRKLILLLTDARPQDSDGYTPEGSYAQHDVRMACIEARKEGIYVFCLSTENDSLNELEIMFPVKRYAVIKSISNLPGLLAKNYLKLTM